MQIAFRTALFAISILSSLDTQTVLSQVSSVPAAVERLAVNAQGELFAGTLGGGVFRSTNKGESWLRTGLASGLINALAINLRGYLFAATSDAVLRSTDNGQTWAAIDTGIVNKSVFAFAFDSVRNVIAGGDDIYRSTDNGDHWTLVGSGADLRAMASSPNGTVFAGGLNSGVMRSTDRGISWETIYEGLTSTVALSLAIDSNGIVYAGGRHGRICRSTDNGETWTQISPDSRYHAVYCLAISAKGTIYAGVFTVGVLVYVEEEGLWDRCDLPNNALRTLVIDSSGYIYGGTSGGVFRSTDNGQTWTSASEGLTGIEKLNDGQPATFALSQNYPNPFNSTTTIQFSLAHEDYVTLRVFNLLGAEVASLLSEELRAGTYSTTWNANSVASGIYFYRLQAGEFVQTKEMVVVK